MAIADFCRTFHHDKTSFGHIPSIEQGKRDVFKTFFTNIFTVFYGPSEKCKAVNRVNCMLVSIVHFLHLLCSVCLTGQELVQSLEVQIMYFIRR